MPHIRVDTNFVKLNYKISQQNFANGQRAMANQVGMDSNRFVPAGPPQKGTLRKSQIIAMDGSYVQWMAPYARRQFYAPGGWKYSTPGTGPNWTDKAKSLYIGGWTRAFMKGARL